MLADWQAVQKKLPAFKAYAAVVQDIEKQLARLIGKRFIVDTPFERLQHYPRYLKAIAPAPRQAESRRQDGAARDAS